MSGIHSMQVGKKYLAGDSLGYDEVECLSTDIKDMPKELVEQAPYAFFVKVRYVKSGQIDYWFETNECMSLTYVEELP